MSDITQLNFLADKSRFVQHQLGLLLHAHRCLRKERQSGGRASPCARIHCPILKGVIVHMRRCEAGKSCSVPHCSSSRQIISHFLDCKTTDCPVCLPFEEARRQRYQLCDFLAESPSRDLQRPKVRSRKRKFSKSVEESALHQGTESALEDFGRMLTSGEDSDVMVRVQEAEFRVHKFVLISRSPVFSAMFRHDTAERASNTIVIDDCDPRVFKEYLQYLYTGNVLSLTRPVVLGLYRLADKYLADNLKDQCVEFLRDALSVEMFCDVVQLAMTYRESGLWKIINAFAAKHIHSIVCSKYWQRFLREHPVEANRVIMRSFIS